MREGTGRCLDSRVILKGHLVALGWLCGGEVCRYGYEIVQMRPFTGMVRRSATVSGGSRVSGTSNCLGKVLGAGLMTVVIYGATLGCNLEPLLVQARTEPTTLVEDGRTVFGRGGGAVTKRPLAFRRTEVNGRDTMARQSVGAKRYDVLDEDLRAVLNGLANDGQRVKVNIVLKLDWVCGDEAERVMDVEKANPGGEDRVWLSVELEKSPIETGCGSTQWSHEMLSNRQQFRAQQIGSRLKVLARRHGWSHRDAVRRALEEERDYLSIELTRAEIRSVVARSKDLVSGIELWFETRDQ